MANTAGNCRRTGCALRISHRINLDSGTAGASNYPAGNTWAWILASKFCRVHCFSSFLHLTYRVDSPLPGAGAIDRLEHSNVFLLCPWRWSHCLGLQKMASQETPAPDLCASKRINLDLPRISGKQLSLRRFSLVETCNDAAWKLHEPVGLSGWPVAT